MKYSEEEIREIIERNKSRVIFELKEMAEQYYQQLEKRGSYYFPKQKQSELEMIDALKSGNEEIYVNILDEFQERFNHAKRVCKGYLLDFWALRHDFKQREGLKETHQAQKSTKKYYKNMISLLLKQT